MKSPFLQSSLSRQFLFTSFPILLAGTLGIGWWIGQQVQESVLHRLGSITALYVESFVAPHLQGLGPGSGLPPEAHSALDADLKERQLGKKIVSLRIWRRDGYVLYDSEGATTGRSLAIDEGLATALTGSIYSEISERSGGEQASHGQPMPRLIETYTPIHADRTGAVLAAAEFYELPDEVDREARAAQWRSWLVVAGCMLAIYLCLFLVVRRGSRTILDQRRELSEQVRQLTDLNRQNAKLHERVRRAAERTTSLNENFLQRIAADIHDGPGQDLGFALMQIKNIGDAARDGHRPGEAELLVLEKARLAIESAVNDLRALLAGIELPDIAHLGPAEIAERVVRDVRVKTGARVELELREIDVDAPLPVKVALYRLLQESLANAIRHGQRGECHVALGRDGAHLTVDVRDPGPGFDPAEAAAKGRLGLRGMRQRVEVLGGAFELATAPGAGTHIAVRLPLALEGQQNE